MNRAVIEVFAAGATAIERGGRMGVVLAGIGAAVTAARTLGGSCDWVQPQAPAIEEIAEDGVVPICVASVPVILIYASSDPLG